MEKLPESNGADYLYAAARAGASLVPVVGGPLQVLLETVIASPVGKRKDAWMQHLADVVAELQRQIEGLTPEELAENDMFVTAVAQASQIAVRTHQDEKIESLKNAVLHAGLPSQLQDDQQLMFFRFIDELTPWHFRLLVFFRSPGGWFSDRGQPFPKLVMGGITAVLEAAFPDLRGQSVFYGQLIRDLQTRGLVQNSELLRTTMSLHGVLNRRTTPFGDLFLDYIG